MSNQYTCSCGRIFKRQSGLNQHKNYCKIYLLENNLWEEYCAREAGRREKLRISSKRSSLKAHEQAELKKQSALTSWIAEKHVCEKCGKVMTEKYASGRFCSRSCANGHKHSEESKLKVSRSVKQSPRYKAVVNKRQKDALEAYTQKPSKCIICGKVLSYKKRYNQVCSKECQNELIRQKKLVICAQQGTNLCGKGLRGYYKGYYCQSSWELAYVIYQLEHDVKFERNKDHFTYILDGITRSYFPDFILEDGTYIEVKGYYDRKSKEKFKQFPKNKTLILYNKLEMLPILKYVQDKYGKNFTYLYDKE